MMKLCYLCELSCIKIHWFLFFFFFNFNKYYGIKLCKRINLFACFCFVKPNGALAMVLKSGEGVGSEAVEKNVMRHVYQNLEATSTF